MTSFSETTGHCYLCSCVTFASMDQYIFVVIFSKPSKTPPETTEGAISFVQESNRNIWGVPTSPFHITQLLFGPRPSWTSTSQSATEAEVIKYNRVGGEAILARLPAVLETARTGYLIKTASCYITSTRVLQKQAFWLQEALQEYFRALIYMKPFEVHLSLDGVCCRMSQLAEMEQRGVLLILKKSDSWIHTYKAILLNIRALQNQVKASSRPASCFIQWPARCLQGVCKQGRKASALPSICVMIETDRQTDRPSTLCGGLSLLHEFGVTVTALCAYPEVTNKPLARSF